MHLYTLRKCDDRKLLVYLVSAHICFGRMASIVMMVTCCLGGVFTHNQDLDCDLSDTYPYNYLILTLNNPFKIRIFVM